MSYGARCGGSKSSRRIQRPWVLHSPSFKIWREFGDTANVLGDKETRSRLNETVSGAVSSVIDQIILKLAKELQTIVKLEAVAEDLDNLEVVFTDRKGNPRTTLKTCRITGVELELRDVEVWVCLFVDKIEFKCSSGLVVPGDFVWSNPRVEQFPSGLVFL